MYNQKSLETQIIVKAIHCISTDQDLSFFVANDKLKILAWAEMLEGMQTNIKEKYKLSNSVMTQKGFIELCEIKQKEKKHHQKEEKGTFWRSIYEELLNITEVLSGQKD